MAGTMTAPLEHTVAIDGGVATIAFARPQAYNALTAQLLQSLRLVHEGADGGGSDCAAGMSHTALRIRHAMLNDAGSRQDACPT